MFFNYDELLDEPPDEPELEDPLELPEQFLEPFSEPLLEPVVIIIERPLQPHQPPLISCNSSSSKLSIRPKLAYKLWFSTVFNAPNINFSFL